MKKIRFLLLALVALVGGLSASATKTVYIQPNAWSSNAVVSLWIWTDGSDGSWATLTEVEDGIYKASFDDAINRMKIARGTSENLWQYNETDAIDVSKYNGELFSIDANSWTGINVNSGITVSAYTEPLLRDYYLEGDVALVSEGWNAADGNKMTKGADNKFTLTKENVLLTVGEYKYKVLCKYPTDGGIWYPAGDNKVLSITENGYYNVAFTFDLTEGEPTAVATLVKSIYIADFNLGESFSTVSDHYFSIGRDWKHIADFFDDDGDPRYMTYTYYNNQGVNATGTILAYRQYASEQGYSSNGKVVYDMLVSPKVSGEVSLMVKASTATTSYPQFVEFYIVNENGTVYGDQITGVKYYNADGDEVAELSTTDWVTAKFTVTEATRIGIRGQYVYMDNFMADEATVMPEKKLKIASAVPSATDGTIYWDQQPNGKVLVKYTVTVQNTGETTFAVNDEGYSVSIYNRKTGEVYGTTNVPEALAPNATSAEFDVTAEVEPTIWPNSYTYINMDLKENISGSFVQRAQSHYNEYAPKFVFCEEGSTSSFTKDIAFGKITEQTSKSYDIYNDGTAPLVVNSISVPEGYTVSVTEGFTVEPKASQTITITLPATTPGIYTGNLDIVYVDKTGANTSYKKTITGTVLDPLKNIITFDDGAGNAAYPQGSVRYTAYISSEGSGDAKNYYLQGTGSNPLYIAPLMTAEAGEAITFDAEYTSYSGCKVEVMISTDRQNWTTIQTVSNIASSYNWTTYTATISEAGNYYLGFKLTNSKVDNIYGLVYAPVPEHDLLLIGEDLPATATQNADYIATVKVGNVGPNVEAAGTYTASLYVDGQEVATANNVDLPVANINGNYNNGEEQNYTVLTFTYKPHTPGTFPAYIEVKAGDVVLKTAEVELVVAEETVTADAGTAVSGTTGNTPLQLNYCNSESISLYTGKMLGLQAGDKIKSITWKGYCTDSKEVETNLSIYYEWTNDTEQAQPAAELYNTEGMTAVIENKLTNWEKKGAYGAMEDYIVANFTTPLVYDGSSNLRLVVRSINPEGKTTSNYKSVTFEKADVTGTWCYAYWSDGDRTLTGAHTAKDLPAIHLGLVVEPTTLAGTVTDGTDPVEGATVTLRNEANDVEYFATTAADGSYSINVIQDNLNYVAVADKDGFVAPVQNVTSFADPLDFALAAPAYGEIDATASAGYFKYLAQEDDKLVVTYTENPTVDNVVKFTKPNDWSTVYAYAWDSSNQPVGPAWHGTQLTDPYFNEFTQEVYSFTVPNDAVGIIFNDGGSNQTVNITDFTVTGYFTDGSKDGEGHYNVVSWTDNNTAIELFDAKCEKVADATLDNGTATVVLTDAIIAKLASGLYVTVKGTEANITKVELVKDDSYILAEDADGVVAGTYAKVKIARKFNRGWNAVCLPFDLSVDEVNAAFGTDCEMAVYDGDTGGESVTVKFKKVEAGQYRFMTASYPYLIWLENPVSGVKFTNKTIESETPGAAVEGAKAFEYVGVYTTTDVNAGDYFVAGGTFVKATTNNKVKPFRAYLKVKGAAVRSVNFIIGEEATTIEGLTVEREYTNDAIYNLNGQKVQQPTKRGLYIINGKKVMVK